MPKDKNGKKINRSTGSNSALGFEATLWATADKLRGNLDTAEYEHLVLGVMFLKCYSAAFAKEYAGLQKEMGAFYPLRLKRSQLEGEFHALAVLRDALLPNLLLGDLGVPANVNHQERIA